MSESGIPTRRVTRASAGGASAKAPSTRRSTAAESASAAAAGAKPRARRALKHPDAEDTEPELSPVAADASAEEDAAPASPARDSPSPPKTARKSKPIAVRHDEPVSPARISVQHASSRVALSPGGVMNTGSSNYEADMSFQVKAAALSETRTTVDGVKHTPSAVTVIALWVVAVAATAGVYVQFGHLVATAVAVVLGLVVVNFSRAKTSTLIEFEISSTIEFENGMTQDGAVWHQYAQFRQLAEGLAALGGTVPQLPSMPIVGSVDLAKQRQELSQWLAAVVADARLRESEPFHMFVRAPLRADWPAQVGPINLAVQDMPHASSCTEWWYFNSHVKDNSGREYSVFAAFFRLLKHVTKDGERVYGHALQFAVSDVQTQEYLCDTLLDRDAPKLIKSSFEKSGTFKDPLLKRALGEILDGGKLPLPDRMFKTEPVLSTSELNLDFESGKLRKQSNGSYQLTCKHYAGKFSFDLNFVAQKAPVRHGLNGVVKGHDGDDMFYYFIPRCQTSGTLTLKGDERAINGIGWYDHEFGGRHSEAEDEKPQAYAWNWAAVQLTNGWELSAAVLVDPARKSIMETRVVVIDPSGARTQPTDLVFEPTQYWQSLRTFIRYPTSWRLVIPSIKTNLVLQAPFPDQEFITLIVRPAFWEGRVSVSGTFRGANVEGLGYVERNGFDTLKSLGQFFNAVGERVRDAVAAAYPMPLPPREAQLLVASEDTPHYMHGVPLDHLCETLVHPVRIIADRGGKSWRSYGCLGAVDVVGGDCRLFESWLALPEFMHVGSLVVDDVQDKSLTRRGGPCSHLVFGEPLAINAGTAAYFQCQTLMGAPKSLSPEQLNRVYDLYFSALRGGHAGQALDIHGLDYLMDDLVESGDNTVAEERILAIHRLKTGVPASVLAKMGALAGGGTEEQIQAVGHYFECMGVAFQIMDDVLNLRGLYTNEADLKAGVQLKTLGEDITAGKVTIPVVKAMGRLKTREERANLWRIVSSKTDDRRILDDTIALLERLGAIDACVDQATTMVEEAWKGLDGCTENTFAKFMLRAFGWYVIERQK